jgi:hypothetical protein
MKVGRSRLANFRVMMEALVILLFWQLLKTEN